MCRHLAPAVLLENFDALAERLEGGKLPYLYQRCAPLHRDLPYVLKKQQPSAHAYVCVKLGLKITDAEACKPIKERSARRYIWPSTMVFRQAWDVGRSARQCKRHKKDRWLGD